MEQKFMSPITLWVPDYSSFHFGCKNCGNIISQSRGAEPVPCFYCASVHYCSFTCLIDHFHLVHRPECIVFLSQALDVGGMEVLDRQHAMKDLQLYCVRWRDALGDAAIAALDIQKDLSMMERYALVVHLNYVRNEPYRIRRFSYSHSVVQSLSELRGETLNSAILTRDKHSIINQNNGMLGSILIVLACNVPTVGFIFVATYVGPEPTVLTSNLPQDWDNRLRTILA